MVNAGHPDFDDAAFAPIDPDEYKPGSGTSFRGAMLAMAGVPMLVYAVTFHDSTEPNQPPYGIYSARFLDKAMRLTTKDGLMVPEVNVGDPFTFLTGAKMITPMMRKLLKDGVIRDGDDDSVHAPGVIGRLVQGKATKGNPPLMFQVAPKDEQIELNARLVASDTDVE